MFASLIEAIVAFLKAIPLFAKYFPPKSLEEKEEEGQATVAEEVKKIEDTGRP